MPSIWKPQSQLVYLDWIRQLKTYQATLNSFARQNGEGLTDWERKFIDDLYATLFRRKDLTYAQAQKLEQIYTKYT